ncbi:LacI family DNA-binding transcriptional regulator [Actinoplanes sp. NPDC051861]|uniref:LacI family DNA-binding transcriptional regulator n=1 Tax=Actinoplanes sp. NPDC051861 TaxID=3155170 RepID=UPI0034431191
MATPAPAPDTDPADHQPDLRPLRAPRAAKERGTVMRDVAKLAGVSHQTVSRVLNEHPNVRAETRERVLAAMRSLNYRRNLAARTLATRESHTLGIIGFETTLFGPESMLYGIESAARAAGYLVSVATVRELAHRLVLEAVDRLAQHDVDGIIAIAPKPSVITALTHAPAGLACVAVGGAGSGGDPFPTVRVDNTAGARLATRHLLDLGHATVHHVAGPPDWPESQARVDGWRETLYAAGAVVPPVTAGWWDAAAGYEQGLRLAADPFVTAIFCANDRIALGVLRALHEAGRRVPEDVSVVGYDDMPDSGYFIPPLSTVHQDFGELGRRALAVLLRHMGRPSDDAPPEAVLVAPRLIPRSSTSTPRLLIS